MAKQANDTITDGDANLNQDGVVIRLIKSSEQETDNKETKSSTEDNSNLSDTLIPPMPVTNQAAQPPLYLPDHFHK